ncbi:hypothetical protein Tco_0285543 [Tanacetum coccineum]
MALLYTSYHLSIGVLPHKVCWQYGNHLNPSEVAYPFAFLSLQILVHWSNIDLLGKGYEKKCCPKLLGSPLTDTVNKLDASRLHTSGEDEKGDRDCDGYSSGGGNNEREKKSNNYDDEN